MSANKMELTFSAISENEAFARVAVAAFAARTNPTLAEAMEIKTAVSEAVTNAIIHGYEGMEGQVVTIECEIIGKEIEIKVIDQGRGIEDVEQAKEPLYTGKPDEERSGMGFTVMEEFMDSLEVESRPGCGTTIIMRKRIC